jgi:Amidase
MEKLHADDPGSRRTEAGYRAAYNDAMAKSRRDFLSGASVLMAAAAACKTEQKPGAEAPPAGAPPAFGTSPEVGPPVSTATFAEAEKLLQFELKPDERQQAAGSWRKTMAALYERRTGPRKLGPDASAAPATLWNPMLPGLHSMPGRDRFVRSKTDGAPLPTNDAEIAYASLAQLSRWIESRKLTSERLTHIYLDRMNRFDSKLRSIITLTRDQALEQAKKVDAEIAAGKYRGPLHGCRSA